MEYKWAERREFLHHDRKIDEYRNDNTIWSELYTLLLFKREDLPHDSIDIEKTFNEIHFQCVRAFLIDNPEKNLDDSVKISKNVLGTEQNAYICHCAVYALLSKVKQKSLSINLLLKVYEKRLVRRVPKWFEVFKDFADKISSPEYEELDLNPTPVDTTKIYSIFVPTKYDSNGPSGYPGLDYPEDEGDFSDYIESHIDANDIQEYVPFFRDDVITFTKLWRHKYEQLSILKLILTSSEYLDRNNPFPPSDEDILEDKDNHFLNEYFWGISEIKKLIKFIEEKGDLYESMPGLYELDKGTYKDEKGILFGGKYRLPIQKNENKKNTDAPSVNTETQEIDKDKLEQELTKFFREQRYAQEFCKRILTEKQVEIPNIYAEYKHYKKVKDNTSNRSILKILKSYNLYSCSESNWNTAIRKYLIIMAPNEK